MQRWQEAKYNCFNIVKNIRKTNISGILDHFRREANWLCAGAMMRLIVWESEDGHIIARFFKNHWNLGELKIFTLPFMKIKISIILSVRSGLIK